MNDQHTQDPKPVNNRANDKPKPFKSKLQKLPTALLDGVDTLVDEGHSADHIRKWLVDNRAPSRLVPNRKTISAYMNHRRQRRIALSVKGREVISDVSLADLGGVDPADRPELVKRTIATALTRIELIKRIQQEEGMSPSWERVLVDLLDLLRKLAEAGDNIEYLKSYYEAVARIIIEKFMSEMAPVIRKAVETTYGTGKTNDFLTRLSKDYKTIDMARIIREAYAEIDEMTKGEQIDSARIPA